jgi:HlyD family secretion protein
MVTQGDVIAVVASPALETQFADAQAAAARLREQDVAMTATEETAIAAAVAALDAREQECRRRIERASMTAAEFSKAIETKRDLVRQGLLAEADLLGSINTQLEIERSLSEARNEQQRVAADRIDIAIRHRQERQRRGNALADMEASVRQLGARMSAERNVIAPRPGKVVQLGRGTGDVVRRGSSVAVISDAGDGRLRCYAFFPLSEGKRVRADMAARVEPSVADRERYGTIRGSVRDIEPVVGTSESLLRIINSPEMAQDLQRRYGGIVSAVIDLQTDSSTVTGLRWSGRGNYPQALTAGTLCEVDVVTEDVSPITLLVPWVKQVFGG